MKKFELETEIDFKEWIDVHTLTVKIREALEYWELPFTLENYQNVYMGLTESIKDEARRVAEGLEKND